MPPGIASGAHKPMGFQGAKRRNDGKSVRRKAVDMGTRCDIIEAYRCIKRDRERERKKTRRKRKKRGKVVGRDMGHLLPNSTCGSLAQPNKSLGTPHAPKHMRHSAQVVGRLRSSLLDPQSWTVVAASPPNPPWLELTVCHPNPPLADIR